MGNSEEIEALIEADTQRLKERTQQHDTAVSRGSSADGRLIAAMLLCVPNLPRVCSIRCEEAEAEQMNWQQ
jgi:hypothetical protein